MRLFKLLLAAGAMVWGGGYSSLGDDADGGGGEPLAEEAGEFAENFAPRGAMADGSKLVSPEETVRAFELRDGVAVDVVAAEPEVMQPLFMTWDFKGRLWVVQYLQYPFPAGLKIVRYDQYLRAVFDRVPEPPPHGPKGGDKITIFEDEDGDGVFESKKDVVTGLNMATSVLPGNRGFWVLQPPYLLRYADVDGDDVSDGDPVVHLSGFGLEDTHSLANSLRWGPDGWIYGVNGSTTTASISTRKEKNVAAWKGQCVWRYHPTREEFEIYAEGGGNTFSLEIDSAGRVFSGTNGGRTRGMHYEQGSYGSKNWGKHGALTNPYAFGYFDHMGHEGDGRRFAQAFAIYEGGAFSETLEGRIIAPNALHNVVWVSRLEPEHSTFRTVDEAPLLETGDRWFRPVDVKVGPDGGIYIADWSDSRLSHVSPVDDWDKGSGRIYRARPEDGWEPVKPFDLEKAPVGELVDLLGHKNKWFRRMAVLQLGWRGDEKVAAEMVEMVLKEKGQKAVEAVWVVHLLEELDGEVAVEFFRHENPVVRRVAVRLLGDTRRRASNDPARLDSDPAGRLRAELSESALWRMGREEKNVEVRAQLAATARRMWPRAGLELARQLGKSEKGDDGRMGHLIWWAIQEFVAEIAPETWSELVDGGFFGFGNRLGIARKLARRLASEPDEKNYAACVALLEKAPDAESRGLVLDGVLEGFDGKVPGDVPEKLAELIRKASEESGGGLVLGVRGGEAKAVAEAVRALGDGKRPMRERLELAAALGESRAKEAVKPLLATLAPAGQYALKRAAMRALAHFDQPEIAKTILQRWQNSLPDEQGLRETAQRVLAGREPWARALLKEVDGWRIPPEAILSDVLQQASLYGDAEIGGLIAKNWPAFKPLTSEVKIAKMAAVREVVGGGKGSIEKGAVIYGERCGGCHRLFGEGADVAPDLTGYERGNLDFWLPAIIDPSLEIREGYVTHVAEAVDGRTLVGFVAERGADSVTLRDPAGNLTKLGKEELKALTALKTSLMPEGLLEGMGEQGIRDLFVYLMHEKES